MANKTEETKIKKIVLSIEGKELILSVDGAKQLKTLLNDLFGREVITEHHYPYRYNQPWYYGNIAGTAYLSDSASVLPKGLTGQPVNSCNDLLNKLSFQGVE